MLLYLLYVYSAYIQLNVDTAHQHIDLTCRSDLVAKNVVNLSPWNTQPYALSSIFRAIQTRRHSVAETAVGIDCNLSDSCCKKITRILYWSAVTKLHVGQPIFPHFLIFYTQCMWADDPVTSPPHWIQQYQCPVTGEHFDDYVRPLLVSSIGWRYSLQMFYTG